MIENYKSFATQDLVKNLASGKLSSQSLLESCLANIGKHNPTLGAFLDIYKEEALAQAKIIDEKRAKGLSLGPLAGIPIAVKDNIHILGKKTTCGSKMLANFVAPFEAHAIERLKAEEVILLGKTNLDEFGMGSSTEHSAFGPTRNPYNLTRVPGGSSGGSAAAIAANMAPLALGSSTGGSIRQPAAFCGIVGLKPTYGRVSRYGLVAYGSSLDQIGPMAGDVYGVALLMQAIAGNDQRDATATDTAVPNYIDELSKPPSQPVIGIPKQYYSKSLNPEIQSAINLLSRELEANGAQLREIDLPNTNHAIPAYYLLAMAEASSNLSRFDGARYGFRANPIRDVADMYAASRSQGFGPEVKRRILLGTYCLSSGYYEGYYLKAQKVRTLLIEEFQKAFETVDALLAPTTPDVAFPIGEKTQDPESMYLSDIYTVTANLAGLPAISLPCGKNSLGLPIGVQLIGNHYEESKLLRLAKICEEIIQFSQK